MQSDGTDTISLPEIPAETAPGGQLPSRLRLLCVSAVEPSWISLALRLDAEGCLEPQFRWVSSAIDALAILRDESFDCVLICGSSSSQSSKPTHAPVSLLGAIRAAGCDDPVIIITTEMSDDDWAHGCEFDCEILVSAGLCDSPALAGFIKKAISRVELARENHRLSVANRQRMVRERDEAEHLLNEQRQIIVELDSLARLSAAECDEPESESEQAPSRADAVASVTQLNLPAEMKDYYHELLRTYVIMGSGNLGTEIARLANVFALAGLSPREVLALHLERVESLVRGLGNRSTRHVMARADLLALELMIHLGECYQRLSQGESLGNLDTNG